MAPKYYDLTGAEVSYYYPVDALEALELGLITTEGKDQKTDILINCGGPKKEEPTTEIVKEEPPVGIILSTTQAIKNPPCDR